jgi:hypothetical protein
VPRETIWGDVVTVRVGDLPVAAARTRADLAALDPAPTDPLSDPPTNVLRRRHQLLSQLVEATAADVAALPRSPHASADAVVRDFRERHAQLVAQLDRLPLDRPSPSGELAPNPHLVPNPDLTPPSVPLEVDLRDPATELRLQQTVTVAWGREDLEVRLFTAAHDHDAGQPVDLGGHWVTLGWSAVNQLIRKLRVARDQAFGVPE